MMHDVEGGSVQSCSERVQKAAWSLAVGQAPLPERLRSAVEALVPLRPQDFPPDLRIQFARISEAMTRRGENRTTGEGQIGATVRGMSEAEATDLARDIWSLFCEVNRREAVEHYLEDQEDEDG